MIKQLFTGAYSAFKVAPRFPFLGKNYFSQAARYDFKFQDILMLKKYNPTPTTVGENEQMANQFTIYFKSQQLVVNPEQSTLELEQYLVEHIPNAHSISLHQYTHKGEVEIAASTPLMLVLQEDFIIKINEQENYVVLTRVDDPPVIDMINQYPITQHPIQEYLSEIDMPQRTRVVLSNLIQKIMKELSKTQEKQINKSVIALIMKKIILQIGLNAKREKQVLDQQLAYLLQKEQKLSHMKQEVIMQLEAKEQQVLNQIYFYLFAQIAFTQYGTYVSQKYIIQLQKYVWGWGVMEPITFLFGVVDLMIAYSFWMRTTKSYKFENVLNVAVNKHLDQKLSEVFYYKDELFDVQRMVEHLKFKQMLYSTNFDEVLNVIEGAVEGKISKMHEKEQESDNED